MNIFDYKFLILIGLTIVIYLIYREVESLHTKINNLNKELKNTKDLILNNKPEINKPILTLPQKPINTSINNTPSINNNEIKHLDTIIESATPVSNIHNDVLSTTSQSIDTTETDIRCVDEPHTVEIYSNEIINSDNIIFNYSQIITPAKTTLDNISPEKTTLDNISPEKTTLDNISPEKITLDNISPEKTTIDNVLSENPIFETTEENMTSEKPIIDNVLPENIILEITDEDMTSEEIINNVSELIIQNDIIPENKSENIIQCTESLMKNLSITQLCESIIEQDIKLDDKKKPPSNKKKGPSKKIQKN